MIRLNFGEGQPVDLPNDTRVIATYDGTYGAKSAPPAPTSGRPVLDAFDAALVFTHDAGLVELLTSDGTLVINAANVTSIELLG